MGLVHTGVLSADDVVDELGVVGDEVLQPRSWSDAEHDNAVLPSAQPHESWQDVVERCEPAIRADELLDAIRGGERDPELVERRDESPRGELGKGRELAHRRDPEHVLELSRPPHAGGVDGALAADEFELPGHAGRVGEGAEHVESNQHPAQPVITVHLFRSSPNRERFVSASSFAAPWGLLASSVWSDASPWPPARASSWGVAGVRRSPSRCRPPPSQRCLRLPRRGCPARWWPLRARPKASSSTGRGRSPSTSANPTAWSSSTWPTLTTD